MNRINMSRTIVAFAFLLGLSVFNASCEPAPSRSTETAQQSLSKRETADASAEALRVAIVQRIIQRTKAQHDRAVAAGEKASPELNILVISGGGDWGAFGAGCRVISSCGS
jgi:hypothetical protein